MEQIGIRKKQGSIVEVIRNAILSGSIQAGTEMTQNELAQDLGVSRMPVREALILLEYQGLVRRLPNNHVQAAELSEGYFESLFKMCTELESDVMGSLPHPESIPLEEMEFHRFACGKYPYEFQKKILETITEIYISYATGCSSYDREMGKVYIRVIKEAVMMGNEKKMMEAFCGYFQNIKNTIINERRDSKC
ncbi:MAG: GntR family transcriptional regulator [Lachnospiraceae bacterium]|nr:GntR family transcriptional regulator [Lachnospiraceae bacterium]